MLRNTTELADLLQKTKSTVMRYIDTKRIEAFRIGAFYTFTDEAILQFLEKENPGRGEELLAALIEAQAERAKADDHGGEKATVPAKEADRR